MASDTTMPPTMVQVPLSMPPPAETTIFRLMDLPPELREEVYYHASPSFPPLETSKPDVARVPAIAQLSQQTRKEALAVFYRHREIHLSLHSDDDILSATGWLDSCARNAELSNKIYISGRLRGSSTFTMKISCSKREPQFSVTVESFRPEEEGSRRSRPAGKEADLMQREISHYLEKKLSGRPEDRKGRLTVGEMRSIVNVVRKVAGCA